MRYSLENVDSLYEAYTEQLFREYYEVDDDDEYEEEWE